MLTLSIFCSPFLRQMLCERHDLTFGPGSEMWIHLTMQFKEIHILKKRKKKEEQRHQHGTFWLFYHAKNATEDLGSM